MAYNGAKWQLFPISSNAVTQKPKLSAIEERACFTLIQQERDVPVGVFVFETKQQPNLDQPSLIGTIPKKFLSRFLDLAYWMVKRHAKTQAEHAISAAAYRAAQQTAQQQAAQNAAKQAADAKAAKEAADKHEFDKLVQHAVEQNIQARIEAAVESVLERARVAEATLEPVLERARVAETKLEMLRLSIRSIVNK